MRKARAWFIRIAGIFGKSRRDRELAAELESHLQLHIDDNLRAGMTPQEARRRAIIKLGGIESTKENYRDRRGIPIIETLLQDVRFGLRMLRRNPGFALAVVLTLALGIGANVTMFSVVDSLLFRMPDHVRAPEQLVHVSYTGRNGSFTSDFQGYQAIQRDDRSIDLTIGFDAKQDFDRGISAQQINTDFVDANYFRVLGTRIEIGREFAKDENQEQTAAPVAILSYQFWQKQFAGDVHVLGKQLSIGERVYSVIGIAPKGFNGAFKTVVDAWLPLADSPTSLPGFAAETNLRYHFATAIGRLRGNVSIKAAAAEADATYLHGGGNPEFLIEVEPLYPSRTAHLSENARISLWLAGVAIAVLLIGCANVTNLFLVRITQRQHEMAIRLQLGASRSRLVSQVMVESLLLSAIGAGAALVVMAWSGPLVRAFLFKPGYFAGEFLNYRVAALTFFFAALAGLASGIVPAWRASRADVMEALKSGGHGQSAARSGLRSSLLVTQVALTLVLTVGAGLFIRSLKNVHAVDLGFEPDRALIATIDLRKAGLQPAEINAVYDQMLERVRQVPGVESVGVSTTVPLDASTFTVVKIPDGKSPSNSGMGARILTVSPGFIEAIGMKVVQGRSFNQTDRPGAPNVAIVNESFVHEVWPDQNPIGRCIIPMGGFGKSVSCWEIVGVIKNMNTFNNSLNSNTPSEFLLPLQQVLSTNPKATAHALIIRVPEKSAALSRAVSAALESVVPNGRYVDVHPLSQGLDPETRSWRLGASMFSFFGALALTLAAVGIYGVLAFLVRQRTSEIGIRMALGALPGNILGLVLWKGMKLVLLGSAIGVAAALGLSRLLRTLLFGVRPTDLTSYLGATGVMMAVALLACLLPAWRAARVDPAISLRHE
jgi:putative ABC transport system permease protein